MLSKADLTNAWGYRQLMHNWPREQIREFCDQWFIQGLDLGGCWVYAEALQLLTGRGMLYGAGDRSWGPGHVLLFCDGLFFDSNGAHTRDAVKNDSGWATDRVVLKPIERWSQRSKSEIWYCRQAVIQLVAILKHTLKQIDYVKEH